MGGPGNGSIGATVAGFIVWLARARHLDKGELASCVTHAERFLDWQAQRHAHGVDPGENTYLVELRRARVSEAFAAQARHAITLLHQYQRDQTAGGHG